MLNCSALPKTLRSVQVTPLLPPRSLEYAALTAIAWRSRSRTRNVTGTPPVSSTAVPISRLTWLNTPNASKSRRARSSAEALYTSPVRSAICDRSKGSCTRFSPLNFISPKFTCGPVST